MITANKRERRMHLRTSLKVALFSILILLVLAVSLIVTLLYSDPTRLKEQIETLARQQGIELMLSGDIGWSIYPNIQFIARGATAGYTTSSMHLDAEIGYLNFALKPWPALRGELVFVGVEVSDAVIDLQLEGTEDNQDGLERSMEDASVLLPPTKIEHLEFVDVTVNLTTVEPDSDTGSEKMSVQVHKFAAEDLASDGDPFAIQGDIEVTALPSSYRQVEFEGHLLVEPEVGIYAADFRELSIRGQLDSAESHLEGESRINLDLGRNQWSGEINLTDQGIAGLKATYAGALSPIIGEGRVELSLSELSAWSGRLGLADDQSLPVTKLVVDTDFTLDEALFQLQNLRVRADENSGKGTVAYGLQERKTLRANLTFDQLDLTPYLDSKPVSAVDTPPTLASANSDDPADKFAAIRELDELDIELNIGRLEFADREVEQLQLLTKLQEGVGELTVPSARFAGGGFALSLDVDLAESDQISNIQMNLSGLQLEELGIHTEDAQIGGTLDLSYAGFMDLSAGKELAQGLQGRGRINFTELAVRNINIEQMLCEAGEVFGASCAAN